MFLLFLIGWLVVASKGILISEDLMPLTNRSSVCYGPGTHGMFYPTCPGNDTVIAIQRLMVGAKLKTDHCPQSVMKYNESNVIVDSHNRSVVLDFMKCCFPDPDLTDSEQCAYDYDYYNTSDAEYHRVCSGYTECKKDMEVSWAPRHATCSDEHMDNSNYMYMEYSCIDRTRIEDLCSNITKTSTRGRPLYLQNYNYPEGVSARFSTCHCQVSFSMHKLMVTTIDVRLKEQQALNISGETDIIFNSDNEPGFNGTTHQQMSNFSILFTNERSSDGGYIWIGLESDGTAYEIHITCNSKLKVVPTTIQPSDTTPSSTLSTLTTANNPSNDLNTTETKHSLSSTTKASSNPTSSSATNIPSNSASSSATNVPPNSASSSATNTPPNSASSSATNTPPNSASSSAINTPPNSASSSATNTPPNSASSSATNTLPNSASSSATNTPPNSTSSSATNTPPNSASLSSTNAPQNPPISSVTNAPTNSESSSTTNKPPTTIIIIVIVIAIVIVIVVIVACYVSKGKNPCKLCDCSVGDTSEANGSVGGSGKGTGTNNSCGSSIGACCGCASGSGSSSWCASCICSCGGQSGLCCSCTGLGSRGNPCCFWCYCCSWMPFCKSTKVHPDDGEHGTESKESVPIFNDEDETLISRGPLETTLPRDVVITFDESKMMKVPNFMLTPNKPPVSLPPILNASEANCHDINTDIDADWKIKKKKKKKHKKHKKHRKSAKDQNDHDVIGNTDGADTKGKGGISLVNERQEKKQKKKQRDQGIENKEEAILSNKAELRMESGSGMKDNDVDSHVYASKTIDVEINIKQKKKKSRKKKQTAEYQEDVRHSQSASITTGIAGLSNTENIVHKKDEEFYASITYETENVPYSCA